MPASPHQRIAVNRQVRLKSRPTGIPQAEHFEIVEAPLAEPAEGRVVLRNLYRSVDPAVRGWVSGVGQCSEPAPIGGMMRSFAVGRSAARQVGDVVAGMLGWQDFAVADAFAIQRRVGEANGLPISTALGVLGINGLTAYFALLDIGQPTRARRSKPRSVLAIRV